MIYNGLRGFCGGIVVIFYGVKSGEMLDFSGFCRSGYRSDFGDFGVILIGNLIFEVEVWMEQICRSWLLVALLKM